MLDLAQDRLKHCRAFLLDMDGTIYVDEKLLPGALDFIEHLQQKKIPYLFLTNNSSTSGSAYQERLTRLGIAVNREKILTSGDATISYLLSQTTHRSVCLLGTPALEADFLAQGFMLDDPDPDCVVVGFDTTLTFAKLERACSLLFRGKPYFATHPDRTCITARGLIPDIAAIIAACEAVTRRLPKIIGKPYQEMVDAALSRLGAEASYTAMVGDQLDTDMTMAQNAGLCGVLVLSGETKPAMLAASEVKPALCLANIGELLRIMDNG
jgi:HAD superfamily hydrolase (TIGR01450 family)